MIGYVGRIDASPPLAPLPVVRPVPDSTGGSSAVPTGGAEASRGESSRQQRVGTTKPFLQLSCTAQHKKMLEMKDEPTMLLMMR